MKPETFAILAYVIGLAALWGYAAMLVIRLASHHRHHRSEGDRP